MSNYSVIITEGSTKYQSDAAFNFTNQIHTSSSIFLGQGSSSLAQLRLYSNDTTMSLLFIQPFENSIAKISTGSSFAKTLLLQNTANKFHFNISNGDLYVGNGTIHTPSLNITSPPVACPAGSYVTYFNGLTSTCTEVNNITNNLTLQDKITFKNGETIDNLVDGTLKFQSKGKFEDSVNVTGNVYARDNLFVGQGAPALPSTRFYSNDSNMPILFLWPFENNIAKISTSSSSAKTLQLTNAANKFHFTISNGDLTLSNGTIQISANQTALTCGASQEGQIYYDGSTKKHYGCNSTTWNALY